MDGNSSQQQRIGYTIRRADQNGNDYLDVAHSSSVMKSDSEQHYFVIEWDKMAKSRESYDFDSFFNKPLEHSSVEEAQRRKTQTKEPVQLYQCIQAYLQPERLSESDVWFCPKCKNHVRALKKLDIWSLPEVLVVHLKRFRYTRYTRNKLDNLVRFPINDLDLTPYVTQKGDKLIPPKYDLFAVSNHYGSLSGGHYTAYCKMPDDGKWYSFDDSNVSQVNDVEASVVSEAAYVLFYRRQTEQQQDSDLSLDQIVGGSAMQVDQRDDTNDLYSNSNYDDKENIENTHLANGNVSSLNMEETQATNDIYSSFEQQRVPSDVNENGMTSHIEVSKPDNDWLESPPYEVDSHNNENQIICSPIDLNDYDGWQEASSDNYGGS
eukprot:TRINITY_DN6230_c1_g1_i1.p1 TRINITY_DN6230_c1_g1~~TRINITY_DN6230_c1_g1_i1.p1  ORF type:complete len:378 (+),score=48.66 TRINITY_DN6230_c1_g1_i1:166-1299(+)